MSELVGLIIRFPPGTPEWAKWIAASVMVAVFVAIVWIFATIDRHRDD